MMCLSLDQVGVEGSFQTQALEWLVHVTYGPVRTVHYILTGD